MNKISSIVMGLAAITATAGCQREATGQVAAVVNGEEITLQEINAELRGVQLPEGADKKAAQQQALQRIVERRLLAGAAKADGIENEQEYLLRSRQVNDALLVQMLSEKSERSIQIPGDAAIKKFIDENPAAFGNRTIYATEQIQFAMPSDPKVLSAMQPDRTMDQVAARLTQLGIKFNRGTAELDSMQLEKPLLEKILSLPQGEPFILPAGRIVTVAVITGTRSAPVTGDEARALAAQGIRNQSIGSLVQQRLSAERAKAKIEYQQGFAPTNGTLLGKQ